MAPFLTNAVLVSPQNKVRMWPQSFVTEYFHTRHNIPTCLQSAEKAVTGIFLLDKNPEVPTTCS